MRRLLLPLLVTAVLPACSSIDPVAWIPSHKLVIYQGNEVTQDMVDRLQPGMSRQQVRAILGTPLLNDPFHANRWDYNYTVTRDNQIEEQRNLAVYFDNDVFTRVEGTALPAAKPAQIIPVAPGQTGIPVPTPDQRAIGAPAPTVNEQQQLENDLLEGEIQ